MPLYDFLCPACGAGFEELVKIGEVPPCPACGSTSPVKQLSAPVAPGRSQAFVASARRQAAKEGLFSNYSRAELRKVPR